MIAFLIVTIVVVSVCALADLLIIIGARNTGEDDLAVGMVALHAAPIIMSIIALGLAVNGLP
jgi:hypothetical protein